MMFTVKELQDASASIKSLMHTFDNKLELVQEKLKEIEHDTDPKTIELEKHFGYVEETLECIVSSLYDAQFEIDNLLIAYESQEK